MLWISGILVVLGSIYFGVTRRYKKEEFKQLDKREHSMRWLYPSAYFLLSRTNLIKKMHENKKQRELLQSLYLREDGEAVQILYWCKKISYIFLILFFANIVVILSITKVQQETILENGTSIKRYEAGQGDREYALRVYAENKEIENEQITVTVSERRYTKMEYLKKIEEAKEYIKEVYLGSNPSADQVRGKLNLITVIPDSEIEVVWEVSEDGVIEENGRLENSSLPEEGVDVVLKAILFYGEEGYPEEQLEFPIHIYPKQYTKRELFLQKLKKQLVVSDQENMSEDNISLPRQVEGIPITFYEEKKSSGLNVLLFGIIFAAIVWFLFDKSMQKKQEAKSLEMMIDYPELMNKFTLLLEAGMTIKNAWGKIAMEYQNKLETKKGGRKYAYEEWLITWYELCNGISEVAAFDHFGKRIKLLPYSKFSSLLAQNIKKGSKGLLELLEYEALEAFEERKELAKRLGEQASTKLLMPMCMMLIIVFIIIMVPALLSF